STRTSPFGLPDADAGPIEIALDGEAHRRIPAQRDRLGEIAIRAANATRRYLYDAHLPLQSLGNLNGEVVSSGDLREAGMHPVVHDVKDDVGPVVILDLEHDRRGLHLVDQLRGLYRY